MSQIMIATAEGKIDILDHLTKECITEVEFLAIHPTISYGGIEDTFSITHIPSGRAIITNFKYRGTAIRIAREIIKDIPELAKVSNLDDITEDMREKARRIKGSIKYYLLEP